MAADWLMRVEKRTTLGCVASTALRSVSSSLTDFRWLTADHGPLTSSEMRSASSLSGEKATISAIINEVLAENPKEESEAEASASEEEEEKKPAKGKKRPAEAAPDDPPKQPKSTCRTASGDEAPKNVKKMQESMKMTAAKFLRDGPTLKIDLCGNELQGPPRTFSSGNKG